MVAPVSKTTNWHAEDYDLVIDVRAPAEYADDHIPGAVNMPVLSDRERAEIGTLYKQTSPFAARRAGAALVSVNIAAHLRGRLAEYGPDFTPLVHCWRGGQRSGAFARVLSEIGWRCHVLEGGYKAYRRDVLNQLDLLPSRLKFIIVAGRTGSAKTELLARLADKGAQILDLEALACHRGSLLGALPGQAQPAQRCFESLIIDRLRRFTTERPVFVESESSRIGNLQLPPVLWQQICASAMITIQIPVAARAEYLLGIYHHLLQDDSDLKRLITGMRQRHGIRVTKGWQELLSAGQWQQLAAALLEQHYDPAYDASVSRHQRPVLASLRVADCTAASLNICVDEILRLSRDAG